MFFCVTKQRSLVYLFLVFEVKTACLSCKHYNCEHSTSEEFHVIAKKNGKRRRVPEGTLVSRGGI